MVDWIGILIISYFFNTMMLTMIFCSDFKVKLIYWILPFGFWIYEFFNKYE